MVNREPLRTATHILRVLSPRQQASTVAAGVAASAVAAAGDLPGMIVVLAGLLAIIAASSLVSVRVEAWQRPGAETAPAPRRLNRRP